MTVDHQRHARDGHRRPLRRGDAGRAAARAPQPRAGARPSRAWRRLRRLRTRWMNGIMFYLHRDVPILHGHTIYIDSDWALTSISQRQFWPRHRLRASWATGTSAGILSVDVSDWERPARRTGKVALEVQRRRDQGRGVGAAQGPPQRPGHVVLDDANLARAVPRRGHHLPQPERGAPTPSRCSSTPPARGPTGPRR